MTAVRTSLLRCERASALVEIAVFAPFLIVLLVCVIDIGRLERYNLVVGNSARAGVQYGAQNATTALDTTGISNAAKADAQNLAGLGVVPTTFCQCSDGSAATCSPPTVCTTGNHLLTYVSVRSTFTFKTLFNYLVIPTSMSLARTEIMEVAQ